MIPTQNPPTSVHPRPEAGTGAATHRTEAPGEAPPVASPGRSTEQRCTRCQRTGVDMVTIAMGTRRWRYCAICAGRGDKTTITKTVVCAHPYSRAHHDGTGVTTYTCVHCFAPVPAPPEAPTDAEHRDDCAMCADTGHAGLSVILPVAAGFGGLLLALSIVSGTLRTWIEAAPLPTLGPSQWPLFVFAITGAYAWWRMRRADTPAHPSMEELLDLDDPSTARWYEASPFDLDSDGWRS